MKARSPRWALSFADICLLLLGFLLILQARPERRGLAEGMRVAFDPARPPPPVATAPARALFEPGEAMLSARGDAFVAAFAARAGTARVRIASRGSDAANLRLDGWELAAARAAALARALNRQGIAPARVTLSVEGQGGRGGQRLTLETA